MTKKEVAQLLAILKPSYPNYKQTESAEAMVMAYHLILSNYTAESVMKAARLHIATSHFFPSPSDLVDKIVRAGIVYNEDPIEINRLESGEKNLTITEAEEQYLDNLCKFVGLGYDVGMED